MLEAFFQDVEVKLLKRGTNMGRALGCLTSIIEELRFLAILFKMHTTQLQTVSVSTILLTFNSADQH